MALFGSQSSTGGGSFSASSVKAAATILKGGADGGNEEKDGTPSGRAQAAPMGVVADRAFTSRSTLQRIEAGDPGVGIGIYAATLQALGLLDGLADLANLTRDSVGQALGATELPERARPKRKTKSDA
jgi:hypothetical protein